MTNRLIAGGALVALLCISPAFAADWWRAEFTPLSPACFAAYSTYPDPQAFLRHIHDDDPGLETSVTEQRPDRVIMSVVKRSPDGVLRATSAWFTDQAECLAWRKQQPRYLATFNGRS